VLYISPERDGQCPRQRHNADALTAPARGAEPALKPRRQRTVGLPAQSARRDLEPHPPELGPAGFTDPVIPHRLVTARGDRHQPEQRPELAAIVEGAQPNNSAL
jgi:hypothetical protein